MTICTIPGHGPTTIGIIIEPIVKIPRGAKVIQPIDTFSVLSMGEVQIIAEFGSIDILSCGCEFNTK